MNEPHRSPGQDRWLSSGTPQALEFKPAPEELASALTYCDMTTSPDGEIVPAEKRSPRYRTATARGTSLSVGHCLAPLSLGLSLAPGTVHLWPGGNVYSKTL